MVRIYGKKIKLQKLILCNNINIILYIIFIINGERKN